MDVATLRERIVQRLLDDIEEVQFPSSDMMDRVEEALASQDDLTDYAELLVKKVEATRYPSISMLHRVDGLLDRLEQIEGRQRAQQAQGNGRREPAALSR